MQIFSEATSELIDHALFTRNVLLSEASEFLELGIVLIHGHAALLEIAELLTLALNNTLWNDSKHFCSRLNNASDSIKQGAPKSGMALITNL